MTYEEARTVARQRWGQCGVARENTDGSKVVGTIGALPQFRAYGVDMTWEEAFAHAARRLGAVGQ